MLASPTLIVDLGSEANNRGRYQFKFLIRKTYEVAFYSPDASTSLHIYSAGSAGSASLRSREACEASVDLEHDLPQGEASPTRGGLATLSDNSPQRGQ